MPTSSRAGASMSHAYTHPLAYMAGRDDALAELRLTGRRLVMQWIAEDRARDLSDDEIAYMQGMQVALDRWNSR